MTTIHWDLLSLDNISDTRVHRALARLNTRPPAQVLPAHIVSACLFEADAQLYETLEHTLRCADPVMTASRTAATRLENLDTSTESKFDFMGEISPHTVQTLEEWGQRLELEGGQICTCGLELLLYCGLKRIDASAIAALQNDFNIPLLIAALAQKVVHARTVIASDKPFLKGPLPAMMLPESFSSNCDDLMNLTSAAESKSLPLLGDAAPWREVIYECSRTLRHRFVRHILLIGERGVGKFELIIELARLLQAGTWPRLKDLQVWYADRRFIDSDESRSALHTLLSLLKKGTDSILVVDGLMRLIRDSGGRSHLSQLLGRLRGVSGRLIALLTPSEYEDLIAIEAEVSDFFELVKVPEPSPEKALPLVRIYAAGLSSQYKMQIPDTTVKLAVRLASDYILHDHLPIKAVNLLKSACDEATLSEEITESNGLVDEIVFQVAARKTGVPQETLRGIAERADYAEILRQRVFGQDIAIDEVATELGLIKGGMSDSDKPASVMLFLGQTGTGKTELAKALASIYTPSRRLKVYTLGNCVEPHSVSTLIGVPPGYVGHDRGGRLVNDLNTEPYSVFLLDEADKAHPDVLQPLLNLFDEGWLMDQRGTRGYADRAIFILTSNVGQRMLGDMVKEGRPWEEISQRMREAVTQLKHSKSNRPVFSAEFLGRIKRFILFRPLDNAAFAAITRKAADDLCQGWRQKRGKQLIIDDEVLERMTQVVADKNEKTQHEGGRLVRKLISEWLEAPLQRAISINPDTYKRSSTVHLRLGTMPDIEIVSVPPIQIVWGGASI